VVKFLALLVQYWGYKFTISRPAYGLYPYLINWLGTTQDLYPNTDYENKHLKLFIKVGMMVKLNSRRFNFWDKGKGS